MRNKVHECEINSNFTRKFTKIEQVGVFPDNNFQSTFEKEILNPEVIK